MSPRASPFVQAQREIPVEKLAVRLLMPGALLRNFLLLLGSQSGGPGALAGPRCHVVRCGRDGAVCVLVGDPAPHGSNILDEPWASQGFGTQGGRLSLVPYGTFVRVSPAVLPATDRSEEGFVPTSLYVGCVPPPGLISHALACCSLQGPGGLGFCV